MIPPERARLDRGGLVQGCAAANEASVFVTGPVNGVTIGESPRDDWRCWAGRSRSVVIVDVVAR